MNFSFSLPFYYIEDYLKKKKRKRSGRVPESTRPNSMSHLERFFTALYQLTSYLLRGVAAAHFVPEGHERAAQEEHRVCREWKERAERRRRPEHGSRHDERNSRSDAEQADVVLHTRRIAVAAAQEEREEDAGDDGQDEDQRREDEDFEHGVVHSEFRAHSLSP